MTHDVVAVERQAEVIGEPARELGRLAIHLPGVPAGVVDEALVLDADRDRVLAADVPGLVGQLHHLRDLAVAAAHAEVRRDVGVGVEKPVDAALVEPLHRVHDDVLHRAHAAGAEVGRVGLDELRRERVPARARWRAAATTPARRTRGALVVIRLGAQRRLGGSERRRQRERGAREHGQGNSIEARCVAARQTSPREPSGSTSVAVAARAAAAGGAAPSGFRT
ncbi:MAG: hypothetical protein U0168_23350 [Nannocystaceae bacterium]